MFIVLFCQLRFLQFRCNLMKIIKFMSLSFLVLSRPCTRNHRVILVSVMQLQVIQLMGPDNFPFYRLLYIFFFLQNCTKLLCLHERIYITKTTKNTPVQKPSFTTFLNNSTEECYPLYIKTTPNNILQLNMTFMGYAYERDSQLPDLFFLRWNNPITSKSVSWHYEFLASSTKFSLQLLKYESYV